MSLKRKGPAIALSMLEGFAKCEAREEWIARKVPLLPLEAIHRVDQSFGLEQSRITCETEATSGLLSSVAYAS